ncbi:MAG: coenzyme F420-0:L-glutamate ligase [Erysipelotrichaceae bacterium]|nr:coenzyme F420-0:L-glutamate ligase [Erysipelotrichaceae bacterium]
MARLVGTVSRGIRCPIIRENDDVRRIVVDAVLEASKDEEWGFRFHDRDIVAITEAIVARAQGNYATVDDIANDIRNKTGGGTVGVVFPILSRNRFAVCLKGIAKGARKIVLMLSYPGDEVGNKLVEPEEVERKGVDPFRDVLTLEKYRELFGYGVHRFTGVDYIAFYKELIESVGTEAQIIFSNRPETILDYTDTVVACDIHTLQHTKKTLREAGVKTLIGVDEILNAPVDGSGYNEKYGLLGSNKATEDTVKLFPRDAQGLVEDIAAELQEKTGKKIEVMIYGDGGFKDPVGGIWEFADPVVSPFYTKGLEGTPNELKIKYLADSSFGDLSGEDLREAILGEIRKKDGSLVGKMASEGTTPRQLTDLIGSLSDLTSGSGDKGTPVVYIQGYFDNYSTR